MATKKIRVLEGSKSFSFGFEREVEFLPGERIVVKVFVEVNLYFDEDDEENTVNGTYSLWICPVQEEDSRLFSHLRIPETTLGDNGPARLCLAAFLGNLARAGGVKTVPDINLLGDAVSLVSDANTNAVWLEGDSETIRTLFFQLAGLKIEEYAQDEGPRYVEYEVVEKPPAES